jgi:hypothetical protein
VNAPRSMQAKSMHFATLIPDWNSLDSVRRAHSDLEAAALVFFALLVLFDILAHLSTDNKKKTLLEKISLCCFAIAVLAEVVAYPYGQRNDTLSGQIIGSLDADAREALMTSGTALAQSREAETKSADAIDKAGKAQESLGKAEGEANRAQAASSKALSIANDAKQVSREARQEADSFEKDIASAKEAATKAEAKVADRKLTDEQVRSIAAKLSGFVGQAYTVTAYWDSKESLGLANRIHSALLLAKWAYSDEGSKGMMLGGEVGVIVWTHPEAGERAKKAATSLIDALNAEGIEATARLQNPQNPKSDMIAVNVGANH